jgi:hypothetical protein
MKFGYKESFLIAVIGSILVIYVVYFATLTGPKRYSSWSLMTATSHDSIKEEFELPPITRKQVLSILSIHLFRVPHKYLYNRKFNISAVTLITRTDFFS